MPRDLEFSEVAPLVAVAVILSALLAFGPLSPFSNNQVLQQPDAGVASGSADVTIEQKPPAALNLTRERLSAGRYILHVPETVVTVQNVSGRPLLTYKVQLTKLGHSQLSIAELNSGSEGRLSLQLQPMTVNPDRVRNDTYTAEVSIILRASGKHVIYQENVTVHVKR